MLLARATTLANKGVRGIGIIALAALPAIVCYDVVARYVFNAATVWAIEISVYIQQLLVFLPMGLLLSEDAHIRSTLLTDHLPAQVRQILHSVALVLVAVLAICITWLGGSLTMHSWRQSQVSATLLAVPLWIPNALVPLGGLLLLINAIGALAHPSVNRR